MFTLVAFFDIKNSKAFIKLYIFCCEAELKIFLKSKTGAEKNEKIRREFCVHMRFTNSWKLDETEREKKNYL